MNLILMKYPNKSIKQYKFFKIIFIVFSFAFIFPADLNSHFKGFYESEEEAKLRAKEIGCEGAFKVKDLWLPCNNEKELHLHLRLH